MEQDRQLQSDTVEFVLSSSIPILATVMVFKTFAWFGLWDALHWKFPLLIWILVWLLVFWRSRRRRPIRRQAAALWSDRAVRLMVIFIIGALLNALAFWADYRFRLPYEPYLAILTSIGVTILRQRQPYPNK